MRRRTWPPDRTPRRPGPRRSRRARPDTARAAAEDGGEAAGRTVRADGAHRRDVRELDVAPEDLALRLVVGEGSEEERGIRRVTGRRSGRRHRINREEGGGRVRGGR